MNDLVEKQKEHFESISETYFNARKNPNHLLLKNLMWDDFFRRNKQYFSQPMKMVEPMCGYAEGYDIVSKYIEIDYQGFDYCSNLVSKVNSSRPQLKVNVGDVTKFSPSESYDLAVVIGGLHHVYRHTDDVLKRIYDSLNPNGLLICLEPTQNNPVFKMIRDRIYKKNNLFDEDTEQAFDLNSLNKSFNSAGFKILDQSYPGLLSYILYYNPDAFPLLNVGGSMLVKGSYALDKLFIKNSIGSFFSFATLTLLKK